MLKLQRVRRDHEAALLEFELANRAYFALSLSDRGDEFYEEFAERHRALLAEQEAGVCVFHVLVDEDQTVVGRFNLYGLVDGTAEVGYRVAQRATGGGVATSGLRDLCRIAGEEYGLRTLRAVTTEENVASQRVLAKAGFVVVGPAEVGGRHGVRYELSLATTDPGHVVAIAAAARTVGDAPMPDDLRE
ncbi:MAG TPA: GNAT family N-acetyltransferase [Candidatus Micrarchaeaceae archaeon]|nr:GNAT family N-acetyltransferase [Candidatus Micrarchaeaceae archaeon]